jgi:hypothetical protein
MESPMPPQTETALEDIAFLRTLAEQGRETPMRGGESMITSGLLFGAASLFHWTLQNRLIDLPMADVNYAWIGAAGLFAIVSVVTRLRHRGGNAKARTAQAAGTGMAIAVYVLLFVFTFATWRLQNLAIMELFSATLFGLFGAFWAVTSTVVEKPVFRWISAGCFLAAIVVSTLVGTAHIYLVNGIAMLTLFVVPGVILKLRERAKQV